MVQLSAGCPATRGRCARCLFCERFVEVVPVGQCRACEISASPLEKPWTLHFRSGASSLSVRVVRYCPERDPKDREQECRPGKVDRVKVRCGIPDQVSELSTC